MNTLLSICQRNGLSGLEFCAGVPATVGGMVTMNFGCWGESLSDWIERVCILTEQGQERWLENKEMEFGYRSSLIQRKPWIVLEAFFRYNVSSSETVKTRIREYAKKRIMHQPLKEKTFGSVFKNPLNHYAGKLLEELGYKGKEQGHCKLSDRHANFLVNCGNASFEEAKTYLEAIQAHVKREKNINLELEVRLVS